jgi:hypothetical protein
MVSPTITLTDPDQWLKGQQPAAKPAQAALTDPDTWLKSQDLNGSGTKEPEGFWHSLYTSTLGPMVNTAAHPLDTAVGTFKQLLDTQKLDAIAHEVKQGNYGKAAALGAMWATETPGQRMTQPVIDKTAKQIQTGDYKGAAGTALGTVAMQAIPVATEMFGAAPAVAAGAAETAPKFELPGIAPEATFLPEKAAASTAGKLQQRMQNIRFGSLDSIQEAASKGDGHAQQVLDQLNNAGEDPDRILQASINLNDYRSSKIAGELYDKVQDLAENKYKLGPIPLRETAPALKKAIADAQFGIRNKPVTAILSEARDALNPKPQTAPGTPASSLVDAAGNPFRPATPAAEVQPAPANTFAMMRKLSDQLGERIRMNSDGENALIGKEGIGQLQAVKTAIDNDLSGAIRKSGHSELEAAGQAADEYYKQVRVPFKDIRIARAAVTTEPDEILSKFIAAGKGDRAQKFYDALDPKGQAAAQYQMFAKSINDATDAGSFSARKFAGSLDKLQDAYGVFFDGPDKAAIDGLKNLAQHAAAIDRAPLGSTGIAAGVLAEGLARLGMPGAATVPAGIAVLSGAAKTLLMTDAGRQFLYRASSLKPGTPAMGAIWNSIQSKLPAMAARTVGESGLASTQQ